MLSLLEGEGLLRLRAKSFLELIDEELAVLRHQEANALILTRVLPHVQRGGLEADLAATLLNTAEGLLPFVQVDHAIFAHIDSIEKILDDRVCRDLLSRKLMGLSDQLAKVSESDTSILLGIELNIYKGGAQVDVIQKMQHIESKAGEREI